MAEQIDRTARGYTFTDYFGPLKVLTEVDGYVLVRRPHAVPFVMRTRDWLTMTSDHPKDADKKAKEKWRRRMDQKRRRRLRDK